MTRAPPAPADSPTGRARVSAEAALTALGGVTDTPDIAERGRLREIERQQALEQTELRLDEFQQGTLDPLDRVHRHLEVIGNGLEPGLR